MTKIKGTGLIILKKLIEDKGPEAIKQLEKNLSPEALKIWESTTLAISWIETELAYEGTFLYEGCKVLFPGNLQKALWETGKIMAKEGLPRFYQIFIRIPTPQFIFKRVAQLWHSFYREGEASIESEGKNTAVFVLRDFPGYDANMRVYMTGYLFGMGDILGLKNIRVSLDEGNPQEWRWNIVWS
ncbi:hypothetical protein K8S19_08075 [bacterium]|nr:hypothetical protein [bacterium]